MRAWVCVCVYACVHVHVCVGGWVGGCVHVHVCSVGVCTRVVWGGACVCVCVCVSSCQATKVLISKYLDTRRVVVSVGGVNGLERQFNCLQV